MLLSADADGFHLCSHGPGLTQRATYATRGRIAPRMRMLLLCPRRQPRNQIVLLTRRGQNLPIPRIHDQHFGGLRAAIDAQNQTPHIFECAASCGPRLPDARKFNYDDKREPDYTPITVFRRTPMPETLISTRSPSCSVNSSGGITPVPVSSTAPCGNT